jgi:hypothetical protein
MPTVDFVQIICILKSRHRNSSCIKIASSKYNNQDHVNKSLRFWKANWIVNVKDTNTEYVVYFSKTKKSKNYHFTSGKQREQIQN